MDVTLLVIIGVIVGVVILLWRTLKKDIWAWRLSMLVSVLYLIYGLLFVFFRYASTLTNQEALIVTLKLTMQPVILPIVLFWGTVWVVDGICKQRGKKTID